MTTRAHIEVRECGDSLLFYKHEDGYPEGVMPMLMWFVERIRSGKIRSDIEQASGWLIVYGANELNKDRSPSDYWKAGFIEPATSVHPDIEFYYIVDIVEMTVKAYKVKMMPPKRRIRSMPRAALEFIQEY